MGRGSRLFYRFIDEAIGYAFNVGPAAHHPAPSAPHAEATMTTTETAPEPEAELTPVSPPVDLPPAEPSRVPPPERIGATDLTRLKLATSKAPMVYPGPVGELLARELSQWERFGYRFGNYGLIGGVVDDILARPTAPAGA